jgi:hypothetical protein
MLSMPRWENFEYLNLTSLDILNLNGMARQRHRKFIGTPSYSTSIDYALHFCNNVRVVRLPGHCIFSVM